MTGGIPNKKFTMIPKESVSTKVMTSYIWSHQNSDIMKLIKLFAILTNYIFYAVQNKSLCMGSACP